MSVKLNITAAGAEILDSIVFMDKSPALAAFKEEIEKILADFNKNKKFLEENLCFCLCLEANESLALKREER